MKRYPVMLICSIVFCAAVMAEPTPEQPRVKIAAIRDRIIYLDEIEMPQDVIDEIGFPLDGTESDRNVSSLRSLLHDEIVQGEIERQNISPSKLDIKKEASEMAQRTWLSLGDTDGERENVMRQIRYKMSKLKEAIAIWKQDREKGEAFYERVLKPKPIGIHALEWKRAKTKCDDEAYRNELERYVRYNRETLEAESYASAKQVLTMSLLRKHVVTNASVSDDEVMRLFKLVQETSRVQLALALGVRETLQEKHGKISARNQGVESLDSCFEKIRLRDSTLTLEWNNPHLYALYVIAIYSDAVQEGSLSRIFKWSSGNGIKYGFLYVTHYVSKDTEVKLTAEYKEELREVLREFKEEQEFDFWIQREIEENAKIYDPRYKGAVEGW